MNPGWREASGMAQRIGKTCPKKWWLLIGLSSTMLSSASLIFLLETWSATLTGSPAQDCRPVVDSSIRRWFFTSEQCSLCPYLSFVSFLFKYGLDELIVDYDKALVPISFLSYTSNKGASVFIEYWRITMTASTTIPCFVRSCRNVLSKIPKFLSLLL